MNGPDLRLLCCVGAAGLLWGCAAPPPPAPALPFPTPASPADLVRYHCEGGEQLTARFGPDSVRLEGLPAGAQELLRDAGGLTPAQRVYANPRWRVEFGLGPDGRQLLLHAVPPRPAPLRCTRSS